MNDKFYIAYGSNLNKAQMAERCPKAEIVGTAEIMDYQLLFKKSKSGYYLTIEKKTGSVVPVAVWKISQEDEATLDMYEGVAGKWYKKTEMKLSVKCVADSQIREITGLIYIKPKEHKIGRPNARYMNTCLQGYRDFGFDENILKEAEELCSNPDSSSGI